MHGNNLPLSLVAAAIDACAHESERLNSERIAECFGSYGIDVVSSEPGLRRSNLYSDENGVYTCRTYQSIGAIFKASGWEIFKETLHIGTARIDDATHPVATLMHLQNGADVAMHVYHLMLKKHDRAIDYATLIELHHPDYLNHADLLNLYTVDAQASLEPRQVEEMKLLGLDAA